MIETKPMQHDLDSFQVEELLSRVDTMATAGRLEEAVEQLSGCSVA